MLNDMSAPAQRRRNRRLGMHREGEGERDQRRRAYARIAPTGPARHGDDRSLESCIRREVGQASLVV
ncbi:hypothetical protein, partial [Burkholderia sp. GbtcB21]|uniref:hypothetical protein n=1 Tax=Burkholderia sp. GbtcB21 TaxID=2824766 RepID=UPI001C2FDEBC